MIDTEVDMIDYDVLSKDMTEYRRDLHKIPELGFFVYETGSYIRRVLDDCRCTIETVAKTGIAAYFDFGNKETLCFRADMDALPIEEETGLPFASTKDGYMHACGHDGHMACLMGFSRILDSYLNNEENFPYNALLVFQPAEEIIEGARSIIDSHIFSKYNVKAIFGLHVWPFLGKGEIASKPGVMMAESTTLKIRFEGLSAHCGEPEKGHDALIAACRFVDLLYDYVESHIRERALLKFGKMESGNVHNAISDHTVLQGTMRTFGDKAWYKLYNAMKHYGRRMESRYQVKMELDTSKYHPAVVNDEQLYNDIKTHINENHLNFVELRRPSMIAEDFSFFEKEIPGIFFFLGTGTGTPLHSNDFNFDESILVEGLKLFNTIFTTYR